MIRKKVVAFVLAAGMMASVSISVLADPYNDINNNQNLLNQQKNNLNNQKGNLDKNKVLYEEAEREIQEIEIKIEEFDVRIESLMMDIDNTQNLIGVKEQNIEKTKIDLTNAEEDIKSEEELFNKRMRSMYINGNNNYIEVILSSKGLNELISNIEMLKDIAEYDKQLISDLKTKRNEIEVKKIALEKEKEILVSLKEEKEDKLTSLKESKSEQEKLIAKAEEKRSYYASAVSEYNNKIKETQRLISETTRKIEEMKAQLAKQQTLSRGKTNTKGDEIVAFASQFLGTPYVWGGAGPKYFDCSGLVQYTYAHFGIKVTRTTYTQVNEGKYVPRNELKSGDLIFFGTKYDVHHVGIYVGNNMYLHAPRTGDVIKISPLTRRDYYTARRILQ